MCVLALLRVRLVRVGPALRHVRVRLGASADKVRRHRAIDASIEEGGCPLSERRAIDIRTLLSVRRGHPDSGPTASQMRRAVGRSRRPCRAVARRSEGQSDGRRNAFRFQRLAASCVGAAELAAAALGLRRRLRSGAPLMATRRALTVAAIGPLAASKRGRGSVLCRPVARTRGRGKAGPSDQSATACNAPTTRRASQLARTGSLGSRGRAPRSCWRRHLAAHGVRVAPYARVRQRFGCY